MRVLFERGIEQWVAARIEGCERGFGKCQAAGVWDGHILLGGVVYHNWCPEFGTIEMSAAAENPRWLTRETLNELMGYPFRFCQMVMAQHAPDNHIRQIWLRLGANEYVIPRLRGRGKDGVISTLTKEQWQSSKFYKGETYGQA